MPKALLITLQGANIGNRLQNYALQTILNKNGLEVYNPIYNDNRISPSELLKSLIKIFLGFIGVNKYKLYYIREKRRKRYKNFDKKYISNIISTNYKKVFNESWEMYDIAFTGSDQVWHKWSQDPKELEYFYLKFIKKDKRVSYAASFGFEKIPLQDLAVHTSGLKEMRHISVREKSGEAIVESIANRESTLVLDPTLLLNGSQWQMIEKKPTYEIPDNYVLVYFLGKKTEKHIDFINNIAKKNRATVIDIFDTNILKYYYTEPDEFIWLIHNAKYVVTDSFHASVFSIIFNINFTPFPRIEPGFENMYNRISCLLEVCGISERDISEDNINWELVKSLLVEKQISSLSFIKESIESIVQKNEMCLKNF